MWRPKIVVLVSMYGGCVEDVHHVGGPANIGVVVTESHKYVEDERLFQDADGSMRAVIAHHISERCHREDVFVEATLRAATNRLRRARRHEREQAKLRVSPAGVPRVK
jgi:hypothetical protein